MTCDEHARWLCVQLCAVVGGVFTVFGILDSMLHGVVKVIKKD